MLKRDQHIIGIFVDYHNIQISLREFFTLPYIDISLVKNYAEQLGKIALFNVYGDWNLLNKHRRILKAISGIKLINEPHVKKSNGKKWEMIDMRMAFDIGVCLERLPKIDLFILVSGDNHFLTVLKQIRIRGKKVLIIAEQNSLSLHLKKKIWITYPHLSRISRKFFEDQHKRFKGFTVFTIKNGRGGCSP